MWLLSRPLSNSEKDTDQNARDPVVYDKAKYHFDSVEPNLDKAYTHTGMFLGWIIDHDFYSDMVKEESAPAIEDFKNRKGKVTKLYEEWDGCLIDDMLNEEGNAFAQDYFDFEKGQFLNDYAQVFNVSDPYTFDVACTWENYEKLKNRIDERHDAWKKDMESSTKRLKFFIIFSILLILGIVGYFSYQYYQFTLRRTEWAKNTNNIGNEKNYREIPPESYPAGVSPLE